MSATEISIQIKNTTSASIDVSLMGNYADLSDNANATIEYKYNVTTLSFTDEDTVSIQYKTNGAAFFSNYIVLLPSQSIAGVVQAINQLGIGSFFSFTSGGSTYISNYENNYTFGSLDIYNGSNPP
jgi:hypothetical protein